MNEKQVIFTKIILSIILLLCLLDMPYGYYQFVRFASMITFGYLAYKEYEAKERSNFFFIWIISAIAFNPIIKFSFGRTIWNIIDVVLALLLVVSIWNDRKSQQ
ncbi:MAG: DUF6804 family protein [Candidatus Kapaibacterium sp.]